MNNNMFSFWYLLLINIAAKMTRFSSKNNDRLFSYLSLTKVNNALFFVKNNNNFRNNPLSLST